MKKIIGYLIALIVLLLCLSWIAWMAKTQIAARFISSHLKVPVNIENLEISKTQIQIEDLWIGTPSRSKTSTSFSAESIDIDTQTPEILSNPLIIDRIDISHIFVGIEYYDNGETNWTYMIQTKEASPKKGRDYLIRTLSLENLTVEVTQANGQKKRYPTIDSMTFHNISSDTGFPIQEIEKAIFNLMMKDLMNKFNLFKLPLNIPETPLKLLPGLFN